MVISVFEYKQRYVWLSLVFEYKQRYMWLSVCVSTNRGMCGYLCVCASNDSYVWLSLCV